MPPSKKKLSAKRVPKRKPTKAKTPRKKAAPKKKALAKKKRSKAPISRARRPAKRSTGVPPLPVPALRWRCDPELLTFSSTSEVESIDHVIGQETAVESLAFGLDSSGPGQNVFIRGLSGTGRATLVRRLLASVHPDCPQTKDCCYVHNFAQPDRPRLLMFEPGRGQDFRRLMDKLSDFIRDDLQSALSSEGVSARRNSMDQTMEAKLAGVVGPFETSLKEAGLTLVTVDAGPVLQTAIFPLVEGRAVAPEEFEQLHTRGEVPDDVYKSAREAYKQFERQLVQINETVDDIRREHTETVSELMQRAARSILLRFVRMLESAFPQSEVHAFMNELVDDVVENRLGSLGEGADFTRLYRVNVVLHHKTGDRCPVITENAPTVRNLLGAIDFGVEAGDEFQPKHMCIRPGSLLRADGGFLIIEDREMIDEPDAWKGLKRALRTRRVQILPSEMTAPGWSSSLKPEAIEINVKVLLLGDPETYHLLDEYDADFAELFKVLADFDSVIPRDEAGVQNYARVIARIASEEKLLPFDRSAVSALVEHGARIAGMHGKLTAQFGRIADVAREAALLAQHRETDITEAVDVREAVAHRKRRANLPSRRYREFVVDGTIRVETTGSVVGQINALAVLQAGPITYGFPTRITASIGAGTGGVINIDREAALSGAIHTKGFYILGGLMRQLLRTQHPLAFNASVAFEQSYGAIDGDSASGAEICCLLSALTDIPIRQHLAMTGAIDQKGNILAVGAVDEKVEGFFESCRDQGALSSHGVIIPKANASDLMLRHDILEACEAGVFHVYAVETVHEALELLTGIPAGRRDARGLFPKGTLLRAAVDQARNYWIKAVSPKV